MRRKNESKDEKENEEKRTGHAIFIHPAEQHSLGAKERKHAR